VGRYPAPEVGSSSKQISGVSWAKEIGQPHPLALATGQVTVGHPFRKAPSVGQVAWRARPAGVSVLPKRPAARARVTPKANQSRTLKISAAGKLLRQ